MEKKIRKLSNLLEGEYGKKVWKVHGDPLSVLIGTILSQNTSDNNSYKTFANLRSEFKNWDEVRKAKVKKMVETLVQGSVITTYQQKQVDIQKEQVDIQREMKDLLKKQRSPMEKKSSDK